MMRGFSLWQPWASAVAITVKGVETRHWETEYRGDLVIHAAKRIVKGEMIDLAQTFVWRAALREIWTAAKPMWEVLPFGALLAVVELVDCKPVGHFEINELHRKRFAYQFKNDQYAWSEHDMGNYSPGRFGWIFNNVRVFKQPVPFKGGQGFFHVPEALVREALQDQGVAKV